MRVLDQKTLAMASEAETGRWRYKLLVEDVETEGFCCESYGVAIVDALTGEAARVRHVTVNAGKAIALLDVLARNSVTPATLGDVVEELLA